MDKLQQINEWSRKTGNEIISNAPYWRLKKKNGNQIQIIVSPTPSNCGMQYLTGLVNPTAKKATPYDYEPAGLEESTYLMEKVKYAYRTSTGLLIYTLNGGQEPYFKDLFKATDFELFWKGTNPNTKHVITLWGCDMNNYKKDTP